MDNRENMARAICKPLGYILGFASDVDPDRAFFCGTIMHERRSLMDISEELSDAALSAMHGDGWQGIEPVAFMHEHPDQTTDFEPYDCGSGTLTEADKKAGWTETPLYSAPPSAPGDAALSRPAEVSEAMIADIHLLISDGYYRAAADSLNSAMLAARGAV